MFDTYKSATADIEAHASLQREAMLTDIERLIDLGARKDFDLIWPNGPRECPD